MIKFLFDIQSQRALRVSHNKKFETNQLNLLIFWIIIIFN